MIERERLLVRLAINKLMQGRFPEALDEAAEILGKINRPRPEAAPIGPGDDRWLERYNQTTTGR